jgi:hypothetical protein
VFTTNWWWSTRFQDFTATANVEFVSWSFTWWAKGNFAVGFWDTFADIFEAWAFVVFFQVTSDSLFFNLGRASVTSDFFFEWTRNVIATVLASSSVTTAVKRVFVTESNSGAVLKILADSWNVFNGWGLTVDKNASVFIASVFRSPFVTDWILDTVMFTQFFKTVIVTDTTGVRFTLVVSFFFWSAS